MVPTYMLREGNIGSLILEIDLCEAIKELNASDAGVIRDRIRGYTYDEIIERRGVSRRRIARLLAWLKERLDA